jgi:hypothetical protein
MDDLPIMERARRRISAEPEPTPARPGPIAGPPRLPSLATGRAVAIAAAILLIVSGVVFLPRLAPPAPPAPLAPIAPDAPTPAAPWAQTAAPASASAPAAAPSGDGWHLTLGGGAQAYAAPDGALLGDVGGRAAELIARAGATWLQVAIDGAGLVWVPAAAAAGQPIGGANGLGDVPDLAPPTPAPAPTAAPAPAWAPPPPAPAPAVAPPPAMPERQAGPADPPRPIDPTPCPPPFTASGCAPVMVAP